MSDQPVNPPAPPSPQPSSQPGGTAVLERERLEQPADPGDHERFSHYVKKDRIMSSAMSGEPVTALCGKVWTPGRDPKKFPVCPTCKEIYEGMRPGKDQGPDGPGNDS